MIWLIFDIGTSAVKAALMTDQGEIVRSQTEAYPVHSEAGGIVEQKALDWRDAALRASRALRVDDDFAQVGAIAVTGQMQDMILVDGANQPVRDVILYSDMRARSEAAEIMARFGQDRLRELTGNDQAADSLWAKFRWMQMHEPDALSRSKKLLLGAADYLILEFTGVATTDTTTASVTGLMNLRERRWLDVADFEAMGIGAIAGLLPTLVVGGAQVGTLTESAAKTLGLKAGIPVYHAPGDSGAVTLGAGCGEIGHAYGYLGTSGWIAFTAAEAHSPDLGIFTLAHSRADQFIPIAPVLTAGGNLQWIRDLFGVNDYANIITQALARPISSLIYLPYLNGERTPFSDPLARGAVIGLSTSTERADIYRAVLEGVVFAYRQVLDILLPDQLAALTLTGGGTRSEGWCQMFADVLGIPIQIAADAENVGVRGALLSAQVINGTQPNYAPEGYFPIQATLQPDFAQHARYEQKYPLFRAAYPALKPIFGAAQL
ncbi:MAG: FGGY family carbohydrate kinase [Chloroflexota bacterium]